MSWQAHQAVLYNSKQSRLFRLMSYLAEHANDDLLIDPAPNQETIANFFETTTRTVRTWINKLIEEGEIEQTRVGSGPGNPSAYRILLQIPAGKGGSKAEENTGKASAFVYGLDELKAEINELKAEVFALKAEVFDGKGGKGGSERRKPLSTESADDPYIDPLINNNRDIDILTKSFEHKTGISSPSDRNPDYATKWLDPFNNMLSRVDSVGELAGLIDRAVDILRNSGYSIASPKSVEITVLNEIEKESRPTPSGNGKAKHDSANLLVELVKKNGRYGGKAKAALSAADWEIVKAMGGWGHVHLMSEEEIKINYYTKRKEVINV